MNEIRMTVSDSFSDMAGILSDFLKKNTSIFFYCEPEIVDFRKDYVGNIILLGNGEDGVKLGLPKKHFNSFMGLLAWWVFGGDKTLYTWDIKSFFSYVYHRYPRQNFIATNARIIDIKYGEAFLGIDGVRPVSYSDAEARAKVVLASDACWNIQHRIHIPLATRVIPKIETAGFSDSEQRDVRYTSYEIEGQIHGRLRCREAFTGGLLVHNLKAEEKARLRPIGVERQLAVLDFKAMEVCVLQNLSKDERLGKIILSGRDIYSTIYSLLYGTSKCDQQQRQFVKRAFLPVVYGLQSESMSNNLGVSKGEASELIAKIKAYFATAMDWVEAHQEKARRGVVCDFFGRPRSYDKSWVVRNAVVQGPAAVVCLEKLIALYDNLFQHCDILATIHDAYVLNIPVQNTHEVIQRAVQVLEETSNLLPNLKLRVDVNVGIDFFNTTSYNV